MLLRGNFAPHSAIINCLSPSHLQNKDLIHLFFYNTKNIFLILGKKSYTYLIYIIIGCALFFLLTLVY